MRKLFSLTILTLLLLNPFISSAQEFLWAEAIGGSGYESIGNIDKTPDGHYIIANSFNSSINIGDTTYSNTSNDILLAKLDPNGEVVWSKKIGGSGQQEVYDIAVNQNNGNIAMTGYFNYNTMVDTIQMNTTGNNAYLVVFDSTGTALWGEVFTGGYSLGDDVEFDAFGNLYCTGTYQTTINIDSNQHTKYNTTTTVLAHFISKFTNNGTYRWSDAYQTNVLQYITGNGQGQTTPVKILSNGDPVIGLTFRGNIIVNGDTTSSMSINGMDYILMRLDSNGNEIWSEHQTGPLNERCLDIIVDQNDQIFTTGELQNGAVIAGDTFNLTNSRSFYLAKFDSSGTGQDVYTVYNGASRGHSLALDDNNNIYFTGGYFAGALSIGGNNFPAPNAGERGFVGKFSISSETFDWVKTGDISVETTTFQFFTKLAVVSEDNVAFSGRFDGDLKLGDFAMAASGQQDAFYSRISDCSTLDISLSSTTGSGCGASSAVLSVPFNSEFNYSWLANNAVINGVDTNIYSAIVPGQYQAVVDSNGCIDSSEVFVLDTNSTLNVTLSSLAPVCENVAPFLLAGGAPSGGVFSGYGVSAGMFDPSETGPGNFTITYTYSDSNGCIDSASKPILVYSAPLVDLQSFDTVCSGNSAFALSGGLPTGGTYTGPGVSSGMFDPSVAGVGTHTIYYSVSNTNCTSTDSAEIVVQSSPTITFNFTSSVCNNASPISLSATPTGGTYSGTGVSGNFFIPQIVNPGSYPISYALNQAGCTTTATDTIQVDSMPLSQLSPLPSVCESTAPLDLYTYTNSQAGYFIGTGVSGNLFSPSTAGSGTHTISFIASNSCGNDTSQQNITVNALPTVSITVPTDICINAPILNLNGGSPSGGTYSGAGVASNQFDPVNAGIGTHTITYFYTNINGCTDSASATITVNPTPILQLDTLGDLCVNRPAFALNIGSPTGGTYFGVGVSSNMFEASVAGVGNHALFYTYTNGNGCSDTSQVTVQVKATFEDSVQHVACDSFTTELGNTYYTSGIYTDSLLSIGNCDSVIVRDVTINFSTLDTVIAQQCYSYTGPSNNVYNASGIYFDTLISVSGCDSVIRTELIIHDTTFGSISPVVCEVYSSPGGSIYTSSGNYLDTLTNANGCDSILSINLTVYESTSDSILIASCDSFQSPAGNILTTSGFYSDTLMTTQGCDSVVHIDLTIFNSTIDSVFSSTCEAYVSAGGVQYSSSGTYVETYSNANGCDSVVVEVVEILNPSGSSTSPIVCDTYTSPTGNTYTSSGTYFDTLTNTLGCDSIITINLTVNASFIDTIVDTGCDSLMLTTSGEWVFSSGFYSDTLSTTNGCDSIVVTEAFMSPSFNHTIQVNACDSFSSPLGNNYYASGNFVESHSSISGCDSIVTYDLTIHYSASTIVVETACDSFSSPSGMIYYNTGQYDEFLTTSNGCDSNVTYDVTINPSTANQINVTSCDSFISPSNTHYTTSGSYNEVYSTTTGCDSTVTYNITINASLFDTVNVTACDSFTSPSGTVYASSGMYDEILAAASGCDSTITYNIDLSTTSFTAVSDTGCGAYISPLGEMYTTSGIYVDTTLNSSGCDSIITYDLFIGQPDTSVLLITACDAYLSAWGTRYDSTGIYADTSTNSNGCDSITILDLTINNVDTTVEQIGQNLVAQADSTEAIFQWMLCDDGFSPISGETNATLVPAESGFFAVEVTQNGCVDTSACRFMQAVGVQSITDRYNVRVFPNPTRGAITIAFNQPAQGILIELRDSFGQLVQRIPFTGDSKITLELNHAAGVYFLSVVGSARQSDHRIIIQ